MIALSPMLRNWKPRLFETMLLTPIIFMYRPSPGTLDHRPRWISGCHSIYGYRSSLALCGFTPATLLCKKLQHQAPGFPHRVQLFRAGYQPSLIPENVFRRCRARDRNSKRPHQKIQEISHSRGRVLKNYWPVILSVSEESSLFLCKELRDPSSPRAPQG